MKHLNDIILRINEKIEELKYNIYFDRFKEKIDIYEATSKPDIKTTEINNTLKQKLKDKSRQEDGLKIENTGLERTLRL